MFKKNSSYKSYVKVEVEFMTWNIFFQLYNLVIWRLNSFA